MDADDLRARASMTKIRTRLKGVPLTDRQAPIADPKPGDQPVRRQYSHDPDAIRECTANGTTFDPVTHVLVVTWVLMLIGAVGLLAVEVIGAMTLGGHASRRVCKTLKPGLDLPGLNERLHIGGKAMLSKEGIELMVAAGCTHPQCKKRKCNEVFLHARCHTSYGTRLRYAQPDVLELSCGLCGGRIAQLSVAETKPVRPECHPKACVWVSYRRGSGKLKVICRQCRKPVTTIRAPGRSRTARRMAWRTWRSASAVTAQVLTITMSVSEAA